MIAELITKVEAATGPDREIDEHVFALFVPKDTEVFHTAVGLNILPPGRVCTRCAGRVDFVDTPLVTASIDAVVELIRREMPGAPWVLDFIGDDHAIAAVGQHGVTHQAPALALLLAFLRAMQARQENDTP